MVMTFAPVSRGGKGKKFKEKIHLDKSKGKKKTKSNILIQNDYKGLKTATKGGKWEP